jgi:serine/threonine-protein kinase
MPTCTRCGAVTPDESRFCPACGGASADSAPEATALEAAPVPSRPLAPAAPYSRPPSATTGRFAPGEVLAGRFRIVGPIGRGGMGEVYRADDLKLGQAVALKFLPAELEHDEAFLARFHAEVRTARQIAHPNVCRVYDIVEADGRHFLTMEYVDGEDLASLLRRIGQLPEGKALEVARQLCAGLAAIHECGVVHRDLKPANVMLDGHGRVRITDFGLALEAGGGVAGDMAGTPAYMAPEQFDGKPPTTRTDLYALGLILYEAYTGKRAFEAASFAQWRERHTHTVPTAPSQLDDDVDAVVERAILRCLEKDPARRPASARALAASLPGGDPLAAAIAAGETPSPEMVAAAGGEGALSPRSAWSLLAAAVVVAVACVLLGQASGDLGLSRLGKSPEVLRDRARELIARLGYEAAPADSAGRLQRDYLPIKYLADRERSTQWRRRMPEWGPPYLYRYRQSPRPLVTANAASVVGEDDPPMNVSGMVAVELDSRGRLRSFEAVPPQRTDEGATAAVPAWERLLAEAGLDAAAFAAAAPQWVPPQPYDERREWTGTLPWAPDVEVRVSAATFQGRPVYFELLGPWSLAERMVQEIPGSQSRLAQLLNAVVVASLIVVAIAFARRNQRAGRGDRRGAGILGAAGVALAMFVWLWQAHHHAGIAGELAVFFSGLGMALINGGLLFVLYLALEPYIRRTLPELLIGWARVAEGRWRDPRVGADIMVGSVAGALSALAMHLANAIPAWIELPGQTPIGPGYGSLAGIRGVLLGLGARATNAVQTALIVLAILFVLRLVCRRTWLAAGVLAVLLATLGGWGEHPLLDGFAVLGAVVPIAWIAARWGLVSLFALVLVRSLLTTLPLPLDADLWYTVYALASLGAAAALVAYAFRVALGAHRPAGA